MTVRLLLPLSFIRNTRADTRLAIIRMNPTAMIIFMMGRRVQECFDYGKRIADNAAYGEVTL